MDVIDVQALPTERWLQVIEPEYFAEYLPAGGAAAKFVIADDDAIDHLRHATEALAQRHGMLLVPISAGEVRLHMLQDVFFAAARALPWDALLQRFVEDLFTRNDYPWPRPGIALTMQELAQEYGVAANLLARNRDMWLSRELWSDARLAQDFRAAMLRLCLARLEPEAGTLDSPGESPVLQWLRGEKVGLTQLRQYDIAARISRTNARAMLISLCHFVRKAGAKGLLLTLDLRPALRVTPAGEPGVRYSPAALMDLYEVLREIIDDIEHLPGLFLLGLADQTLVAGDRRRTLDTYKALEMRIWPDVRPGDRQNPLAPLVTVSG
jgi:BREX system ATP-binding protein BrxC/D